MPASTDRRARVLANLAQGTVCKILDDEEVKPHKVRCYLEQHDPEFAEKMADVLCVFRQVKLLKKAASSSKKKPTSVRAVAANLISRTVDADIERGSASDRRGVLSCGQARRLSSA